jgi:RNase P/RNase MRP subunit p29
MRVELDLTTHINQQGETMMQGLIGREVEVYTSHEQKEFLYKGVIIRDCPDGFVVKQEGGKISVPYWTLCKVLPKTPKINIFLKFIGYSKPN